jgi:hypothetical protein
MTCTLEARWFGAPPLPDTLREWFGTLGPVETSTRRDLYLPAEDPAFNLKLRDQQLQIKRRLAGPLRTSFSSRASGRREQWVKWSFDLQDGRPSLWDQDPTDLWVPVEKTRHQTSILPEHQSSLSTNLPTTPAATIKAELTQAEASGTLRWTLCLEAEGPVSSLTDTLTVAGAELLDDRLPVTLSDDQSYGYVRWLQQLPSVSARPAPQIRVPRSQ